MLHIADNSALDQNDKYTKIRPLIRIISGRFERHFQPERSFSHDEAMIEYFGRHGCKQCIRGKPIRFDYKVWCLNTSDGYLATFDIYQGRSCEGNDENEKLFEKCEATILKNIESLPAEKKNFRTIYTLTILPHHFN